MFEQRADLYAQLQEKRSSRVLAYVTGDRPQLETKISADVLDCFIDHLDHIHEHQRISLLLYTRGGDTLAAWSLVNLIRQFTDELEIIVPSKAHSAGTLMCLGASRIVMTKQATLGPIDPSVNGPLNPQIPGAPAHARTPVSVEALNAYIEFCRESLGSEAGLKEVLMSLSDKVHPLVLGDAFRARSQIRMLAGKLLASQNTDTRHTEDLLRFLCSESGSHDYTINRREARDELGLPVEKPDGPLYNLIKAIYDDISSELALTAPYDPVGYLGARAQAKYVIPRALVESLDGGSHSFVSEGLLKRVQLPQGSGEMQVAIHDERKFEGWRFQAPTQERK